MRKILASMTAGCIAISSFGLPMVSEASVDSLKIVSQSSDSSELLQNAIINVKYRINIPEELSEFSYNYVENNYRVVPYWNLNWRDKEYNKTINVRCDNDGNILYYNFRDYKQEKGGPKFLKEELIDNAKDEIKRLAPNISNKVVLDKITFNGVYNGTYTYNFMRIENGINMPDNTVKVTLRYDTGEMTNFSASWEYNVEVPSNEVKVTEDKAKEIIGENVKMSLEYRNRTEEIDGRKVVKAYLVYVPDKLYVAVDAKTGEVYDAHDEYYSMDEYNTSNKFMESMGMAQDSAMGGVELTEQELEKIAEMKELISKEEAIKIITGEESFYIDENAKAVNARLTTTYDYLNDEETGYIWDINISDPRDVDYQEKNPYRAYIYAEVDAKTGHILSFRANVPGRYDPETYEWESINVKYNREECKKIFEKFVRKTEPEKFKNTKLSSNSGNGYVLKVVDKNNVYGGYTYTYTRYNEGLEYDYNSINGAVDGVTGKIYSYNTNWTDEIVFESPKNAISEKEAYDAYVDNDGFELVYEINNKHYIEDNKKSEDYYDYKDLYLLEKEVRLVHRTSISPAIISPFTGKQLNYQGEVFEDEDEKEYNDISGFWAEREIKLITDLNVNFEGEKFNPDSLITGKEFLDMLNKLGFYVNSDEEEYKESLSRVDSVKIIIDSLGLTKVAELKDIYKVSFNDIEKISDDEIGYVALAHAIGIVSGNSLGMFNPDKSVTRAEAVVMVINLINSNMSR